MKRHARAAVALILCCTALSTASDAQVAAVTAKEDPCATLSKLNGSGKDSSAAIARCINRGKVLVHADSLLDAKVAATKRNWLRTERFPQLQCLALYVVVPEHVRHEARQGFYC